MPAKAPEIRILSKEGYTDISRELLQENGKLKLLPAAHYEKYSWQDFRIFCHEYARYGIPTIELIDYLKRIIDGRFTIEIGAGWGDLGYHLDIIKTDSKLQNRPEIALEYMLMHQPRINYPDDIEELEALDAVSKYSPKVVIGSWVTHYGDPSKVNYGCNLYGIKEQQILADADVETYILIGNIDQHGDRPTCAYEHKTVHAPWMKSRAKNPEKNCIFIWDKR